MSEEVTLAKPKTFSYAPNQTTVIAVTCQFHPNGYTDQRHQEVYDEWKHCAEEWFKKNECMRASYQGSQYLLDKTPPYGQFFMKYVFDNAEAANAYSVSSIFKGMIDRFAGEFKIVSNAVAAYVDGYHTGGG